ncbi:MAG: hypothetical protein A3F74_24420 [Betaproteobacteria bacterium RIFCSPLOWO2_12_FULL_62_58]|nr:MAG: hypothetical protein A3F74_24420 [Betaproteobacteria bacterium RIFCSPLOWO2_12_FULL_62_58]
MIWINQTAGAACGDQLDAPIIEGGSTKTTRARLHAVFRDLTFQIAEFLAWQQADLAQLFEVLLRAREIAHHEVGLANVFVLALCLGADAAALFDCLRRFCSLGGRSGSGPNCSALFAGSAAESVVKDTKATTIFPLSGFSHNMCWKSRRNVCHCRDRIARREKSDFLKQRPQWRGAG